MGIKCFTREEKKSVEDQVIEREEMIEREKEELEKFLCLLTKGEQRIFDHCGGIGEKTNSQIAAELGLSSSSVRHMTLRIYKKTGIRIAKPRYRRTKRKENKKERGTLCWDCKNACGGCSWSRNFTPVAGWNATEGAVKVMCQKSQRYVQTFFVHSCPEFVRG